MNTDFYRNYIAIVECGTLSAAAVRLHVAQSALSMQVKQFEASYGAKLFIRGARQMEPTEAGRIVYKRAKAMIALEDAAHKEVEGCTVGLQGTVRLGMTQAYPDPGLTALLTSFRREDPQLNYEIFECSSSEVIEHLRSGVAELGLIRYTALLPPDIIEHVSLPQRQCVCWKRGSGMFDEQSEAIDISALDGVPIAVSRGFEGTLRDLFARAGVEPIIKSVSTSRSTAAMWAESGTMAAVICLERADVFETYDRLCRPLKSEEPTAAAMLGAKRSLVSLRGNVLSAAGESFVKYAKEFLRGGDM